MRMAWVLTKVAEGGTNEVKWLKNVLRRQDEAKDWRNEHREVPTDASLLIE